MSAGYWPIRDRCWLRVSGADAQRYLNGQLSNDLRKLAPGQAMRACLLTAKGKLVADPYVWREADHFLLEARAELQEPLLARLERYIVADDVVLEPIDTPAAEYHVIGESVSGRTINRIGITGIDTSIPPADLPQLNAETVEALRIRHAMPVWGRELNEDVLPAEAGLDKFAVDFHKGCYVGQEVVSRMETAGRVRRTLAVLRSARPLAIGSHLISETGTDMGRITSSAGGHALAWLPASAALPGNSLKTSESDGLTDIEVIEKLP